MNIKKLIRIRRDAVIFIMAGSLVMGLIVTVALMLYVYAPIYFPAFVVRWSPFVTPYLKATNHLTHGNVPYFFDDDMNLREEWLSTTNGKFGSINHQYFEMAMKGSDSEKKMAIYLLKCSATFEASPTARECLNKLASLNDPIINKALEGRPRSNKEGRPL